MKDLIQKIERVSKEADALEIATHNRSELLQQVGDFANSYIDNLSSADSFNSKKVDFDRLKIKNQTKSVSEILSIFKEEVTDIGLRAASGGHVGYIPGGGIYASALGDFLAAISNEYAGVSYASPGAVAIENEVIDWLKNIFSFPKTAVGNLASGGSISNLIALTAARDAYGVKNEKIQKSVIYLSEQAHHCITKSLRIIGLEDVIIRHIALDSDFRMCPNDLENQIENDKKQGLHPFLIIATAGTTDVGVIDPLDEIAGISHKNNLWFHIDAAYGGFFILTSKKEMFNGIEKADSLVVDPHKGLFLPYGLGAVLIKNAGAVLHSNQYQANYMQDALAEERVIDPANVSPELTKHFRGMRLWLPLQLHGVQPFIACLEEKLLLTEYFRQRLVNIGFKVGPNPDLSVSYFWYPSENDENEFNRKLMQAIHDDGSVFLSSTTLNGKFVIRMAILSFRTKIETIDKAVDMIERCLVKIIGRF